MCILFLVRTKAFRLYGAPFCSPFSNFLHTFFDRKPHFPGLFVMNEKNSTDFWEFDEKWRRISKYSCLNCTRNWFKVDSKTDKVYNKDTYFVRKICALTTKNFSSKNKKTIDGRETEAAYGFPGVELMKRRI